MSWKRFFEIFAEPHLHRLDYEEEQEYFKKVPAFIGVSIVVGFLFLCMLIGVLLWIKT